MPRQIVALRLSQRTPFVIYVKAGTAVDAETIKMWQTITSAPFDCVLELAVIDADGPHALVFPCRRILNGWMNAETRERLDVRPTHWRQWESGDGGGSDQRR